MELKGYRIFGPKIKGIWDTQTPPNGTSLKCQPLSCPTPSGHRCGHRCGRGRGRGQERLNWSIVMASGDITDCFYFNVV